MEKFWKAVGVLFVLAVITGKIPLVNVGVVKVFEGVAGVGVWGIGLYSDSASPTVHKAATLALEGTRDRAEEAIRPEFPITQVNPLELPSFDPNRFSMKPFQIGTEGLEGNSLLRPTGTGLGLASEEVQRILNQNRLLIPTEAGAAEQVPLWKQIEALKTPVPEIVAPVEPQEEFLLPAATRQDQ